MGLHVVEISPQGSVRIARLHSIVMEGYIKSSKLKRFYGSLMLQTSQSIHRDKEKKKEQQLLQKKPRDEFKARKKKLKKNHKTLYKALIKLIIDHELESIVDPTKMMVDVQVTKSSTLGLEALVDLGANNNFISQQVWQSLPHVNLIATFAPLRSIEGNMIDTLEYVTLNHVVNSLVVTSIFYVILVGTNEEHMVLGQTWWYQVNYQFAWRQRRTFLTSSGRTSIMELLKDEYPLFQEVHEQKKDVPQPCNIKQPHKQTSTTESEKN